MGRWRTGAGRVADWWSPRTLAGRRAAKTRSPTMRPGSGRLEKPSLHVSLPSGRSCLMREAPAHHGHGSFQFGRGGVFCWACVETRCLSWAVRAWWALRLQGSARGGPSGSGSFLSTEGQGSQGRRHGPPRLGPWPFARCPFVLHILCSWIDTMVHLDDRRPFPSGPASVREGAEPLPSRRRKRESEPPLPQKRADPCSRAPVTRPFERGPKVCIPRPVLQGSNWARFVLVPVACGSETKTPSRAEAANNNAPDHGHG